MPKINEPGPKPVYPKLDVQLFTGDEALTYDQAMELIGWEVQDKADDDTVLKDHEGRPVRFTLNAHNRPFDAGHCGKLKQEMLNKRWSLNLENIIIGRFGNVLSGQHRFAAFILAVQEWRENPVKWKGLWDTEPVFEVSLGVGVEETPDVIRTFDNVKPRSFADVLHTSPEVFGRKNAKQRAKLCRMLSYAVRLLWDRTGRKHDETAPRQTHSEALDWLDHHGKVKQAVEAMAKIDTDDGRVQRIISPGTAAGLLYLMASSKTDGDRYRKNPSERRMDFSLWDKAVVFWTCLANGNPEFVAIRQALAAMHGVDGSGSGGSPNEKIAILVKAWTAFSTKGGVDLKDLHMERYTDDAGSSRLDCRPMTGGIDHHTEEPLDEDDGEDPTPEELEAEKQRLKEENIKRMKEQR